MRNLKSVRLYGRKHVTETHEYVWPVMVPRWVLNKAHFVHSHTNYCVLETHEYLNLLMLPGLSHTFTL